jgi:hypothetical protein
VIERARKGRSAIKVMAAVDCEQRHLFLLYQELVVSIFEHALAIQTLSNKHIERLERIQNEAMRIIFGCTRDTSCRAPRYLLDLPTIENRIKMCRARSYLWVVADKRHPLHCDILKQKSNRLQTGQSRMGRAEDILEQIYNLKDLEPGEEWIQWPNDCSTLFNVCITLNTDCRMQNPVFVEAEVQALIHENFSENDVIIYTDGSVVRHVQSSWAFTA